MGLFDGIQAAVFSTANQVFGDTAVWTPSISGSNSITEQVLFKNPNDPIQIGETDKYEYRPFDYSFEYFEGQFPNLKESVESGNTELVTVKGFELYIRRVIAKFDGKTYTAYGELKIVE